MPGRPDRPAALADPHAALALEHALAIVRAVGLIALTPAAAASAEPAALLVLVGLLAANTVLDRVFVGAERSTPATFIAPAFDVVVAAALGRVILPPPVAVAVYALALLAIPLRVPTLAGAAYVAGACALFLLVQPGAGPWEAAALAAMGVAQLLLVRHDRRQRRRHADLRASLGALWGDGFRDAAERVLASLVNLLEAEGAILLIEEPRSGALAIEGAVGPHAGRLRGSSLCVDDLGIVLDGEPRVLADPGSLARARLRGRAGVRSSLLLPLGPRGPRGAVLVDRLSTPRPFGVADVERGGEAIAIVAPALREARLRACGQRLLERLSLVGPLVAGITTPGELGTALGPLLALVAEVTEADWAAVLAVDDAGETLAIAADCAGRTVPPSALAPLFPLLGNPAEVREIDERDPRLREAGLGAALLIPVEADEGPAGALVLGRRRPGPFDPAAAALAQPVRPLLASAIENASLRQRVRAFGIAEERARVAGELHDGPLQALIESLHRVRLARRGSPDEAGAALVQIERCLRASLDDMRAAILRLRAFDVDAERLSARLRDYLLEFGEMHGIECRVVWDLDETLLTPESKWNLFHIIREALANVRKHARASAVAIELGVQEGELILAIRDNGRGFGVRDALRRAYRYGNMGLLSMRQRAESLGGTLQITSAPGAGTYLVAHIPLVPGEPGADAEEAARDAEEARRRES